LKILLIGAGGQLGRCLVEGLVGEELLAFDHSRLDVTNLEHIRSGIGSLAPDIVINASAFNDVDGAELHQDAAFLVNAEGPRNLALVTASCNIPLLHVSTDYVFDGSARSPYHEFCETNPLSVYGRSKLAGEKAIRDLNPRHYIVRTAWLFWEQGQNFLTGMYRLARREQVSVVADSFGSPTYVPDLAQAINRLIRTEAYGTYHFAGKGSASRWELVVELYRTLGIRTEAIPVPQSTFPTRATRPQYSALTTWQQPLIELPPWQEGVARFALGVRDSKLDETMRLAGQ
jgi:dTDP-4-dehydrorhamnose reductase